MEADRLTRDFYETPAVSLARQLLGHVLVHQMPEGTTAGVIVEAEAYAGPDDKAAHSYGGRRTSRTEVMFGPPGHAYVFQIYGMYFCFNVVCARTGKPEAVLIRALEPISGLDLMKQRRGTKNVLNLTSGPGKLCQALAITRDQNGQDLTSSNLYITPGTGAAREVASGPRINVDYAEEYRDVNWRFWIPGNPHVSR